MPPLSIAARLNRLPIVRTHRLATVIVGIGVFFDLFDIFLAGVLGTVLTKQFMLSPVLLQSVLASGFLGMFFGAVGLGAFADRFGRRTAFLINLGLYSVFTLAGAFAPNAPLLIAARFIAGIGIGAEIPLCDAYLERAAAGPPSGPLHGDGLHAGIHRRARRWASWPGCSCRCRPWASRGGAGCLRSGRSAAPSFGGCAVVCPSRRGGSNRSAGTTRRTASSWPWRPRRGPTARPAEPAAIPADRATDRARVPLRVLFSPEYRGRTAMLWVFQVFQAVGYYGFGTLVPIVLVAKGFSVVTSLTYTSLVFLGYPLGSALSILVVERVDRRWLIVGSALLMAVFGLGLGAAQSAAVIVPLGVAYTMVANIFSNAFHVFQAEIFPTAVRATAAGTAYGLSRLSSAAMPFILLPLLSQFGAVAAFGAVGVAMLIVMLDIGLFAPSTTGRALEDVAAA